ncbi:acyltransferase family protein [Winogradskyella flava]|uniref:Acyltransferase n=1 Tax=Winogradskyella flava TaxID=1884876 RepID=A0A842IN34_9FLAO|nr:acyltransferase [Winogradskyella flava]
MYFIIRFFKIEIDSTRLFGLDILRALAILFVIYQHAGNYLPIVLKEKYNVFVFDGVSIFFVLSGFLIGRILIQLYSKPNFKTKDLLVFWNRRWLRTLPNYFLALCLLILLNFAFNPSFTIRSITKYLFFLQNFNSPHPSFFPESWSLSVEEWFYFIIPIGLLFLTKGLKLNTRKSVLLIVFTLIIFTTLFRYYKFATHEISSLGDWDLLFRKQVLTRLDSIMYGVLGSYFFYYHSKNWFKHRLKLFWVGLLLILSAKILSIFNLKPTLGVYNFVFSFSVFAIGVLMIIPYLSSIKSGKGFLSKIIIRTSVISYAMYILHLSLVQFWIIDRINWQNSYLNSNLIITVKFLLFWVLTFFLSHILYKYFERPIMNLRKAKTS